MQRHPILGGNDPPKPRATQSTAIQALAGLAQVVVAVVAYLQLNTPRAWWILALGAALLTLTFGGPLVRWIGAFWRRRHDARAARRALPELRSLVRSFGNLVDTNASDILQAGLQKAFRNNHGMIGRVHVPSAHLFNEMLHNLTVRLDADPTDVAHLLRALAEFYTVVSSHSTQCIQPVFHSMPKEARELLTPDARSVLNSYRERYVAFHAEFASFTEDLGATLRAARLPATYYVFRPNALTA